MLTERGSILYSLQRFLSGRIQVRQIQNSCDLEAMMLVVRSLITDQRQMTRYAEALCDILDRFGDDLVTSGTVFEERFQTTTKFIMKMVSYLSKYQQNHADINENPDHIVPLYGFYPHEISTFEYSDKDDTQLSEMLAICCKYQSKLNRRKNFTYLRAHGMKEKIKGAGSLLQLRRSLSDSFGEEEDATAANITRQKERSYCTLCKAESRAYFDCCHIMKIK